MLRSCRFGLTLFIAIALNLGMFRRPQEANSQTYRVTETAKSESTLWGKSSVSESKSSITYTRKSKDAQVLINFNEFETQTEDLSVHITGEKFVDRKKGETYINGTDNCPADIKRILDDGFGGPICRIDLDKSGKELQRTMLAGPGAKGILARGTLTLASFFHVEYGGPKFQAKRAFGLGSGQIAEGTLEYETVVAQGNSRITPVQVDGTLAYSGMLNGMIAIRSTCVLRGQQGYDIDKGEWVSGAVEVRTTTTFLLYAKEIGQTKKNGQLRFERIEK